MDKKYKLCILTTIGSTIQTWFEPVFSIYNNIKIKTTFIANFEENYYRYLCAKYPSLNFINLPITRGINPLKTFKTFIILYKLFKTENYDLVEYHTPNVSFCAALASFFANVKLRVYGQWGIRYIGFKGLKRFLFWLIEKLTCSFSSKVYAQSPKNLLFNINKHICSRNKIDIIGIGGTIGVDLKLYNSDMKEKWNSESRRELGISSDEFVFGYIGRIHKDKGVNELIDAFKQFPSGKLLVMGEIEKKYGIRNDNLTYLKKSKSVVYLGRVKNELVPKYASVIDLFVYPTYREGFGHVLQQMMALGIPIVTTNIPGPSEVIGDPINGILIESHSTSAVLNCMRKLYKNYELLHRYSSNGMFRAINFFDTNIMVQNIKNNYEKLIGDKLYE